MPYTATQFDGEMGGQNFRTRVERTTSGSRVTTHYFVDTDQVVAALVPGATVGLPALGDPFHLTDWPGVVLLRLSEAAHWGKDIAAGGVGGTGVIVAEFGVPGSSGGGGDDPVAGTKYTDVVTDVQSLGEVFATDAVAGAAPIKSGEGANRRVGMVTFLVTRAMNYSEETVAFQQACNTLTTRQHFNSGVVTFPKLRNGTLVFTMPDKTCQFRNYYRDPLGSVVVYRFEIGVGLSPDVTFWDLDPAGKAKTKRTARQYDSSVWNVW